MTGLEPVTLQAAPVRCQRLILTIIKMRRFMFDCLSVVRKRKNYKTDFNNIFHENSL